MQSTINEGTKLEWADGIQIQCEDQREIERKKAIANKQTMKIKMII